MAAAETLPPIRPVLRALPARPSSFVDAIPDDLLEKRQTIKVRSSGRAFMRGGDWGGGGGNGWRTAGRGWSGGRGRDAGTRVEPIFDGVPASAASRRPGVPVLPTIADEDESQDAAVIAVGARVRHRKFGTGTIAELAGSGRDMKVKVDFDDETIGRKTLVVAQANLERGDD